jgi:hypothetical protein
METISRHELVPFTALMNMIKFNYLDKKEVFHTLLSILGDYDPTDDENKKRVLITVDYLFKKKIFLYQKCHLPYLKIDQRSMSLKDSYIAI